MSEFTFKLPDLGEGTVEAEIAEWMVKVGDQVQEEDPICAMLTDKAAVELTAPVSGTVVSVAGEEGDVVAVGAPLIVFASEDARQGTPAESETVESTGIKPASEQVETPATISAGEAGPVPGFATTPGKTLTSPSIRSRAREAGIDLSQIPGSGPRGRILKADFDAYVDHQGGSSPAHPSVAQANTGTTEIKVIGLRRKIAERLSQSSREIPHFTYVEEVDLTALESLRQHLNAQKPANEADLSPLAFIGLALTRALQDFPQCNAHYDSERNVIVRHHGVHLGIATQTADGLKVPVVTHAEARDLNDLAAEIRRVSAAARDGSAAREDLSGSTITITSLGKIGGIVSTPVINQPEVAIIGVNKAVDRPVVHNGQVVVRRIMNLSSSFDHRFVDGFDAAELIQALKVLLEQPALIFIPDQM
jgi:2-oxoisovalerate dehydrogenase E2 component (dihydrolipoyl transacylase)